MKTLLYRDQYGSYCILLSKGALSAAAGSRGRVSKQLCRWACQCQAAVRLFFPHSVSFSPHTSKPMLLRFYLTRNVMRPGTFSDRVIFYIQLFFPRTTRASFPTLNIVCSLFSSLYLCASSLENKTILYCHCISKQILLLVLDMILGLLKSVMNFLLKTQAMGW